MRFAAILLLTANLILAQTPTGAIHGVVKDAATGQPLADFSVTTSTAIAGAPIIPPNAIVINSHRPDAPAKQIAIDPDTGKTISETEITRDQTAYTGSDGKFTLPKVAAGKVTITARNPRRDSVTKEVPLDSGDDIAVEFLIAPNPMASGRVLDPGRNPVAGVKVWAVQSSLADGVRHYSLFGPRLTDSNGSFLFDWGLMAGKTFYLLAEQSRPAEIEPGKPIEASTYYGNTTALDAATPIVLDPAGNRGDLDIQIRKSAHHCVAGTLSVSGKPARNPFEIRDLALAETGLVRAGGASGDDGKYRVCGLTPGQYRIIGDAPNGDAAMEDFIVSDSDVSHVDLSLDAVPLHLTVEWDGEPVIPRPPSPGLQAKLAEFGVDVVKASVVSNVQVSLNGLGSRVGATVNPPFDGLFAARLAVGDYRVMVRPPACCYIKELDYGGIPLAGPLHVGAGSSGTLRVLIGSDGAALECHATDDDGKPVENAAILLIADSPDSEPQLHWTVLAPGKYKVMAVNRNVTLPEDLEKIRAALGGAQSIELAPNARLKLSLKVLFID